MPHEETIKPSFILSHRGLRFLKPAQRLLTLLFPGRAGHIVLPVLELFAKRFFTVLLLQFLFIFGLFGQGETTLSWPLTSVESWVQSGYASTGFSSGSSTGKVVFDRNKGAMAGGWNYAGLNPDAYYEYRVAPFEGISLELNALKLDISLSGGEMHTVARYSSDGFRNDDHQIGQPRFFYTTSPQTLRLATNITIAYPDTLRIRIYAWGASDRTVSFNNRNVLLEGVAHSINGGEISYGPLDVPTVTCPGNIITGNDAGLCSAVVTYAVDVTGTPAPTLSFTFAGATTGTGSGTGSDSTFNVGTTTVTIIATNTFGSDTCQFTITVNDTQDPVIHCPPDFSQNAALGQCSAAIAFNVWATENCSYIVTCDIAGTPITSPYTFPVGITTVHAVATDQAGNTDECSFNVTIIDNQSPVITCPGNITQNADNGQCTASVTFCGYSIR